MDGPLPDLTFSIDGTALNRLMPMHLGISPDGSVSGVGPTLAKLMAGAPVLGRDFFDLFEVRRPGDVTTFDDLMQRAAQRLHIVGRHLPETGLRGLAVPLSKGQGLLLNLSFGVGVEDAVRNHALTDTDFAPTELTMELLYLIETKAAIMQELRALNLRLEGARSEAEELALTDTLTGLRNRRALDNALTRAVLRGIPFGLMHIDLDYFKAVNDSLGHAAGDHVLCVVARELREQTRAGDTIARVGGDEFVIVLPGLTDAARLQTIAERIIDRLTRPTAWDGNVCRISASIGMTVSTAFDPAQIDRMQAAADAALYDSKRAGRGRATLFQPDGEIPPDRKGQAFIPQA